MKPLSGKYAQEVQAYVEAVLEGRKIAGAEVVMACRRFEAMCGNPAFEVRTRDADFVIGIIQATFKHRQGQTLEGKPLKGKPFVLEGWEKFCVYGMLIFFVPGTQERVVKEAFIFIPRKNGKTLFVAALSYALALLERLSGSKVFVVGATLKQAMETFDSWMYNLTPGLYKSRRAAQADGWEKQYPFKVGRKKVYMPPSEAEKHGYERASKHPKSTKYGRQNPIAERWNSEEQLVEWRKAWADVTNRYLERYGHEERIDHRSHADRGLTEQPTIHEGVAARALEKKGIVSDRCEINRQIKADNALLRELRAAVKKMAQAVKDTLPAIAEAMEKLRENMIIFRYQLRHIEKGKCRMNGYIGAVKPELERYAGLVQQIRAKTSERKNLLAEKKETPFYQISKLSELSRRITELTEDLEELKTKKDILLHRLDCADDAGVSAMRKDVFAMENALKRLAEQEAKYAAELDDALKQYAKLEEQAAGFDADELAKTRLSLRPDRERSAASRVRSAYGEKYDPLIMSDSRRDVAALLHEDAKPRSIHERLQQRPKRDQPQRKTKRHEQER